MITKNTAGSHDHKNTAGSHDHKKYLEVQEGTTAIPSPSLCISHRLTFTLIFTFTHPPTHPHPRTYIALSPQR